MTIVNYDTPSYLQQNCIFDKDSFVDFFEEDLL